MVIFTNYNAGFVKDSECVRACVREREVNEKFMLHTTWQKNFSAFLALVLLC